jgi:hypothetical protein
VARPLPPRPLRHGLMVRRYPEIHNYPRGGSRCTGHVSIGCGLPYLGLAP